jgi:hypothetical protein
MLLQRLFPTVARLDASPLDWVTLALAMILLFAIVTGAIHEALYDAGFYDAQDPAAALGHAEGAWQPHG